MKQQTMKLKMKYGILIAHHSSTGTDYIIRNDHEFEKLESGMSVKTSYVAYRYVDIVKIK